MKITTAITCLGLGSLAFGEEPECVEIQEAIQIDIFAAAEPVQIDVRILEDVQVMDEAIEVQIGDFLQLQGVDIQARGAQTEAIPEKYKDHKQAAIIIEGMENKDYGLDYLVAFRVINPTDEPVQFAGFSERQPRLEKQLWRNGVWKAPQSGQERSKQSLRRCIIAPGQSAIIQAEFAVDELPARIGLGYSNGHHNGKHMKLWSEKIGR